MRAWVLPATGGVENYEIREVPDPEPTAGTVRVRVKASALNHIDLWVAEGRPTPPLPHIPGADGAGVIDAVGGGVMNMAPGDEVVINPAVGCGRCEGCASGEQPLCAELRIIGEHLPGTHADFVVVPAANVVPKPAGLSWEEAAAYGVATANALRLLTRARLSAGDDLLVVGFGGGVSSAALLVGKALGARCYVTTQEPSKGERAIQLGAEGWFDSAGRFDEQVRDATNGRGVDVVLENVGPATWDRAMRSLRRGGRLATCGGTSGKEATLNLPLLFWRHLEIIGASVQSHEEFVRATRMVADGSVPVLVDSAYGFDDYQRALSHLRSGRQLGKVVLHH
jgi:NADPH:quinone reductase-like Zn-dependent oxidoreductase